MRKMLIPPSGVLKGGSGRERLYSASGPCYVARFLCSSSRCDGVLTTDSGAPVSEIVAFLTF